MPETNQPSSIHFKCRIFESGNFETHETEFELKGDSPEQTEFLKAFMRHYQGMVGALKKFIESAQGAPEK